MSKQLAALIDLDGTLCDISHRMHLYRSKKYEAFHSALVNDTLNQNVINNLWGLLSKGIQPIFLTARQEKYRELTLSWFFKHLPVFGEPMLFMKADDDARDDDVVKQNIYVQKIQPNYNVVLVLDDRDHVVKMWRSLGLECWQIADGSY